jgi:hypothetical protein
MGRDVVDEVVVMEKLDEMIDELHALREENARLQQDQKDLLAAARLMVGGETEQQQEAWDIFVELLQRIDGEAPG